MTWGHARSAASRVRSGFQTLALLLVGDGREPHGPATITAPKSSANGQTILPDLALRAHRLHNRNSKAAERYLEKHRILAKPIFSGGDA